MLSKFLVPALALAGLAFAQPTHTPPDPATQAQMRVNVLVSKLNLTDAQKSSALTIFTNAITTAQSLQTNRQTARTALTAANALHAHRGELPQRSRAGVQARAQHAAD